MSFDKIYPNRKDKRKPYYSLAKLFRDFRPHGGFFKAEQDRQHFDTIHRSSANEQIQSFKKGEEV